MSSSVRWPTTEPTSRPARALSAWRRVWGAVRLLGNRPRYAFGALALLAILTLALTPRQGPAVDQPIAFNHLKHTGELGLACDFCHQYVTSGAHAGLPSEEKCAMCHRTTQGSSEEAARVTELVEAGAPIRFNKLFVMPDHVFYTHRRHVAIAELECTECHGAIAETERPPDRALVRITMDTCMDCHRERGQTLNCNACHR